MVSKATKKKVASGAKKVGAFMSQILRNAAANMVSDGGATRSMGFWDDDRPPWEVHPESYEPKRRSGSGGSGSSRSKKSSSSSSSGRGGSTSRPAPSRGSGSSSRRGTGGSPRGDVINGYVLDLAADGTVKSAYKNGRIYIPYALFSYTDGDYWESCIREYTPDEIREFIRQKAFRWVDEEKHKGRRGY